MYTISTRFTLATGSARYSNRYSLLVITSMLRKQVARNLSTSSRLLRGNIFPALESPKDLGKFIYTPSWNVSDVLPDPDSIEEDITPELVLKLLKQSGLPHNVSDDVFKKIEHALRTQVGFIDELYDPGMSHGERCANNNKMFRLLASDHQTPEPLDLKRLLKLVELVKKQVDPEKGETGFNHEAFRNTIKFGKP